MSIFNDKALKGVAEAVSKIVEAEKMAKKDHDQDGKIESGKDEYLGSRIRAAKMAGKMKEEAELDEAFPTVADAKKRMDAGKTSTGTVTKTKTGLVHKRDYKDDDNDAEDTPKKPKGYGARQNFKRSTRVNENVQTLNEGMSEDDYHNNATNYPLHNITGNKDGTLHSHSLKYLHDAHAHHEYARDMEEPSEGGGRNGAAAKAVKHIEKHVSQKYGKEAGAHLANSHAEGNFHKVLGAARKHMATMKEEKLSFTEMLHLYNESGVEVINKIVPQTVKFGDTEVELIDANIVNGAVGITVAEEVDNETFTKEVEAQKEKNAGRGKKAEVAKASVQAVKQEEVEQIDEISKELAGKYLTAPQGKGANKYKVSADKAVYPDVGTMVKHGKSVRSALSRTGSLIKKPSYYKEEEQLDEISKKTLGSYIKAASHDVAAKGAFTRHFADKSRAETAAQRPDLARMTMKKADKMQDAGMKRRANMAKAVDRLTKEDVEQIDERTLTSGETAKKEDYVKGMKKSVSGFKARYGDKAKSVMYATATKMAKKD